MVSLIAFAFLTVPADLVIENARIWTDQRGRFASFAAVQGGRFVFVGDRKPFYVGPKTKRVDAKGAVVIPGLIDSHAHMINGGESLSTLQLRDASSKEDFVKRVKDWAALLGPNDWVVGRGWSVESWPSPEQPTKLWLDAVTGGRPAALVRMDGHSLVANSAALKLAGIDKDGPMEEPGGVIDRDSNGEPTGVLRETAMSLVRRVIPTRTGAAKLAGLRAAVRHANSHGITSVCDIPSASDLSIYESLAQGKERNLRLFLYASTDNWLPAIPIAKRFASNPGWVEVKGFKAYMDGSLGSHTAYMHEPFSENLPDKPDWRGFPMPGALDGTYSANFRAASAAGFQCIVHAIGDEGNRMLLDLLKLNVRSLKSERARSEHAQHLLPTDIKRFADLGVIASMQPYHKADDGRYAERHIGAERCHTSYAYKMLLDSGAKLAFGSDWPVVDMNPFLGMEAAVTGRILTGKIWEPQNNISVDQTLRAYTSDAAFAAFEELELGRIAVGFRADFVILNKSIWDQGVDWKSIKPTGVFVEGEIVYPSE